MSEWVPDGHEFALCLTHDVDRPYKTYQSLYYAVRERDPTHLTDLAPWRNPYWTFEAIRDLERDLGVTSAFYFLDEQSLFADRPLREWVSTTAWNLFAGRYDVDDPAIADVIRSLDRQGWEVGLHGSYDSYVDRDRLRTEKHRLEAVLGREVTGGRQHYLQVERPGTWRHQRSVGLAYDTTPGDPDEAGFHDGYDPLRPFDDGFVVFPLTLMERALPDPGTNPANARAECESLLAEAAGNEAVMTVLWHPRYFSDDYDGYDRIYRELIERAQDLGAWVGPPGELYRRLDHPTGATERDEEPADLPG